MKEFVKKLREKADVFEKSGCSVDGIVKDYRKSADMIEGLEEKSNISGFVEKLIEQLEELQEKYKGIRANTHCVVTETSECDSCKADNYLYARLKCIDEVIKIVNKLEKEYKCSQICSGRMLYQCGYEDGQKQDCNKGTI